MDEGLHPICTFSYANVSHSILVTEAWVIPQPDSYHPYMAFYAVSLGNRMN